MAYDGYLRLNGIELANAARTTRYVDNLLPTFGLKGCQDCEAMEASLGETYTTPLVDQAPWYDPLMPSSGSFFGFYPLSIEGIDDSTRQAVTTELVGDGSITNRPRFAGRDILVNGLLIGATDQAVETGMAWLNRALSGPCDGSGDDCLGSDLEFYSSCPQAQDWSSYAATVVNMSVLTATEEAALWAGSEGGAVNVTVDGIELSGAVGEVFSRQITGLIPGETYRLRMRPITNTFAIEIPEAREFHFRHHNLFGTDNVHVILDFIPKYETITLQIVPDFGLSLEISDYTITRMPSYQTVLQTEYDSPGNSSGGWVHAALPAGLIGGWNFGTTSGVRFDIRATGAPTSYPVGSGPTRTITYPNSGRVRVTVQGNFDGPGNALPITMSTALGNEVIIQEIHNQIGTTDAFYYIFEYDAGAIPNQINLESGQAVTATGVSPATWFINYLLIEQVDDTLTLEDPNPGVAFERTLRNVVATSGPVTAERFSMPCGAMRRVTFALRAGVPFHYGVEQFVGNVFSSESNPMPEIECLGDDAAAVNLVTNPRFVTDAPWTMTGFTLLTPAIDTLYPGGRRLTASGAPGLTAQITATYTIPAGFEPIPGTPYVAGVFVETQNITDVTLAMLFDPSSPAGTSGSTTVTVPAATTPTPTLTPIVAQAYASDPAPTQVRITLDFTVAAGAVGTATIAAPIITFGLDLPSYVDDWSFGMPDPEDFFTGASANGSWQGATDASISIYTPAPEATVYDPACPVLPDPPAPPSIDDTCLTLPDDWTRYVIDVPSRFIPTTSSADPIATVITSSAAVNNVRMRFYPEALGPFAACGFEGEMLLSYIPANSQVIVDATRHTATLVRVGFEDQSVTHLLYGPNGGPVQWPDLSCGIHYSFMVDVESGADTDTFQVLLDMAVRY